MVLDFFELTGAVIGLNGLEIEYQLIVETLCTLTCYKSQHKRINMHLYKLE